jgi:hypothetical protein
VKPGTLPNLPQGEPDASLDPVARFGDRLVRLRSRHEVERTFLRPDAKNDAMRVLFVHRDITAGDTKKGLERIQRLLKGERTFMLAYWPFFLDLDEHTKDAEARIAERAKTNQPADESDLLTVSLARRVRVIETGLGTDADGTLVGWQEVVISEWSKFLPDLNRRIALPAESYYRNIVLDRDGCVRLDVRL